jgi:hypothetical protein
VKTDMKELVLNVRLYGRGKCNCVHASTITSNIARLELDDLRRKEPILSSPFEPPSEWLVVLFSTRATAFVRLSDEYWCQKKLQT